MRISCLATAMTLATMTLLGCGGGTTTVRPDASPPAAFELQGDWVFLGPGSLEHALKNGDFAALRKAGHNLKGTGAAYGFAELTDIGRALEAAAKDDNAAAIEALLDQIDAYIGMVGPSPEHRGDYAAGI